MKITVYTTSECQFSKQEKEYFKSHNLPFEEKNLETNKEFLTEMLAVGNNFAGTPVTKIEKDDGTIVVLKGFTKEEFDQTLGFTPPVQNTPSVQPSTQPQTAPPTPPPAPVVSPPSNTVPTPPPPPPAAVAPTQGPSEQPPVPPTNDELNSILNDLQSKATGSTAEPAAPGSPPTPPSTGGALPNIPDFGSKT